MKQRICGPVIGNAQDQVGWGFVQLNLVEVVPAHNKESGTR